MSTQTTEGKRGMFVLDDGRNVAFTFILVSSLFLLWGFCNGMIDVMDKHFQEELKPEQVAIGLGAVRPLAGLLPHVDPRGLAGDASWATRAASSPDCCWSPSAASGSSPPRTSRPAHHGAFCGPPPSSAPAGLRGSPPA